MNYENDRSSDSYATITVKIKNGIDVHVCDFYISKDGVTVASPEDDYVKKQVSEFLACTYTVSNTYTTEK
jgi:hypothetical protein